MDTTLEGLVENVDAVSSEEEDAIEVFEGAEENRNEGVALETLVVAFLEEDVGFVEQEYGGEGYGVVEDLFKALFETSGVSTDVAARY